MLTLVLTRHGATTRSDPEQHLGQHLDVPLSRAGRAEAARLAERLAGVTFERVISSPLRRAMETARRLAPGREPETDARLLEMDYGTWEGLTYEQVAARDGAARLLWEADPASLACPGGESGNDVAARIHSFLEATIDAAEATIDAAEPTDRTAAGGTDRTAAGGPGAGDATGAAHDQRVLVIGHSTTDRILLCVALGVPVREFRRRFVQEPANLTVIRFDGPRGSGAEALLVNDVGHLRGLRGATWD